MYPTIHIPIQYENSHGQYVLGSVFQMTMYSRRIPCIPIQSSILRYCDVHVSLAETGSGCAARRKKTLSFTWVGTRNGPGSCDPSNIIGPTAFCSRVLFCNLPIKLELFPKAAHILVLLQLPTSRFLSTVYIYALYLSFSMLCLSLCFFTTLFLSAHSLMGQNP